MVSGTIVKSVRDYLLCLTQSGLPISFGVVFGSYAAGTANSDSDIDGGSGGDVDPAAVTAQERRRAVVGGPDPGELVAGAEDDALAVGAPLRRDHRDPEIFQKVGDLVDFALVVAGYDQFVLGEFSCHGSIYGAAARGREDESAGRLIRGDKTAHILWITSTVIPHMAQNGLQGAAESRGPISGRGPEKSRTCLQ